MTSTTKADTGLYSVDIRLFLVTLTLAMTAGFIAGVSFSPPERIITTSMVVTPPKENPAVRDAFFNLSPESIASSEGEHLPAGQHLLVDIEGVEEDFLNSEDRLAKAMVATVAEAGLHMLSYHCHALLPSGVSCVGVLLESHISFHTWPSEGVITLDLFTCGSKPLLPVVATIERQFGIGDSGKVNVRWSHELRGFRPDDQVKDNYMANSSDLSLWVLSPLQMQSKTEIYSTQTKFQRVDIWDIVELSDTPTFKDVVKHNLTPGDPRLLSPEFITPNRLLFLDGTLQSIGAIENVYHEAMVHPAMFAHPKPQRVAILGGGEGATLREVLKHNTIESAVMVEIDEELVQISRQYLPLMSDCSDLIGRTPNCFDDSLVSMYYEDGLAWFINRFGSQATLNSSKFDVVLVDALDPEEDGGISDLLYGDTSFLYALVNSLSEEGVLAVQVGTAPTIDDPKPDFGMYKHRERLFRSFEDNPQVQAMFFYEEPQCGFLEPHSFLIVCKSADCRSRWYARSDQIDYEIYDRIVRTHSKQRALTFFDGTTQRSYQWPKKGWETVYCRREPTPFECAYRFMDPAADLHELNLEDPKNSSFRVESIEKDGETTHSVYATVGIRKGSFIMPSHLAKSLMVTTRNLDSLKNNLDVGGGRVAIIADLLEYFEDYAHPSKALGSAQNYVEVGGTCLIRRSAEASDVNVGPWVPPHPSGSRPKYSPVYERHRMSFDVFMVATRDIKKDEQLFMKETW